MFAKSVDTLSDEALALASKETREDVIEESVEALAKATDDVANLVDDAIEEVQEQADEIAGDIQKEVDDVIGEGSFTTPPNDIIHPEVLTGINNHHTNVTIDYIGSPKRVSGERVLNPPPDPPWDYYPNAIKEIKEQLIKYITDGSHSRFELSIDAFRENWFFQLFESGKIRIVLGEGADRTGATWYEFSHDFTHLLHNQSLYNQMGNHNLWHSLTRDFGNSGTLLKEIYVYNQMISGNPIQFGGKVIHLTDLQMEHAEELITHYRDKDGGVTFENAQAAFNSIPEDVNFGITIEDVKAVFDL